MMTSEKEKLLLERVQELEAELAERERDLSVFRSEVSGLNERLSQLIAQTSQQLKIAHLIQKALVPTEIPTISGFEFSTKIEVSSISGGDYFDIFELEDKFRFGVVLSSAAGHGVSALFLSALLKLSSQIEARQGRPPNEAVKMMANEVLPGMQGPETLSLFYSTFDRRVFEMKYCHVGSNNALFFRYGEDRLERLAPCADPVQKGFDFSKLKAESLVLNPRDRLVLVSPGLIQATNSEGEPFGEERLFRAVLAQSKASPHELRNEIFFQLGRFVGDKEWERDVTVVVVEVQDRVIKLARG